MPNPPRPPDSIIRSCDPASIGNTREGGQKKHLSSVRREVPVDQSGLHAALSRRRMISPTRIPRGPVAETAELENDRVSLRAVSRP